VVIIPGEQPEEGYGTAMEGKSLKKRKVLRRELKTPRASLLAELNSQDLKESRHKDLCDVLID